MEIIIAIVIGLFAIVGISILVKLNKTGKKPEENEEKIVSAPASGCCGAHEVCEFDQIKMDETIIEYYDDEELDEFKNIKEDQYTNSQIDQFRDVMYTLKTDEIRHWLLSIERRNINLPSVLLSEARMLITEA